MAFGHNPDGQQHHICGDGTALCDVGNDAAIHFLEARYVCTKAQVNARIAHFHVDERCHVEIEVVHQLLRALKQCYLQAQLAQVFGCFDADVAAAYYNGASWLVFLYVAVDAQRVFHGSQAEQLVGIDARQFWANGVCTRRKDKLVVGFNEMLACFQVMRFHRVLFWMDGGYLVACFHGDVEAVPKALGALQGKGAFLFDHAANEVGKAAIRIRYEPSPFENNDLCLFVESAQASCGRSAASYTANNYNLHD